jgi:hypothetical protein
MNGLGQMKINNEDDGQISPFALNAQNKTSPSKFVYNQSPFSHQRF